MLSQNIRNYLDRRTDGNYDIEVRYPRLDIPDNLGWDRKQLMVPTYWVHGLRGQHGINWLGVTVSFQKHRGRALCYEDGVVFINADRMEDLCEEYDDIEDYVWLHECAHFMLPSTVSHSLPWRQLARTLYMHYGMPAPAPDAYFVRYPLPEHSTQEVTQNDERLQATPRWERAAPSLPGPGLLLCGDHDSAIRLGDSPPCCGRSSSTACYLIDHCRTCNAPLKGVELSRRRCSNCDHQQPRIKHYSRTPGRAPL